MRESNRESTRRTGSARTGVGGPSALQAGAVLAGLVLALVACGGASKPRTAPSSTAGATTTAPATSLTPPGAIPNELRYDMGKPTLTDIWVDPVNGDDARGGTSRDRAKKTITGAWDSIPEGTLSSGYRIALTAGAYPKPDMPSAFKGRVGVRNAPIVIESVDGNGRAVTDAFTVFGVGFLSVIGVTVNSETTAFRCEQCDHVLLRDVVLAGIGDIAKGQGPKQVLRVAQSTNVFVENADVSGATDNAIDFDAVQTGRVLGSRIHRANGWCQNATGGSAALIFEANEYWECTRGGVATGLENNLAAMTAPYVGYQVYGLRFVNNLIHEVDGPAFSANGAYDALFAFNTAYRVGRSDHVIGVDVGRRGCSDATGDPSVVAKCQQLLQQGGWGAPAAAADVIPSRSVAIFNNVIYNPAGYRSANSQFQVAECRPVDATATGVPSPACADNGLVIKGNVIWNGPKDFPLGLGGKDQGCASNNPTCTAVLVTAGNAINTIEPRLTSPSNGDYQPAPNSPLLTYAAAAIPAFTWGPFPPPPSVPDSAPDPKVSVNRSGQVREAPVHPGAY